MDKNKRYFNKNISKIIKKPIFVSRDITPACTKAKIYGF